MVAPGGALLSLPRPRTGMGGTRGGRWLAEPIVKDDAPKLVHRDSADCRPLTDELSTGQCSKSLPGTRRSSQY